MSFKKLSRIISTVVILLVVAVGTTFLHVSTNQVKTTLEPRNASVWGSSDAVGDEWPMDGGALNHTGASITTPQSFIGPYWYTVFADTGNLGNPVVSNGCLYFGSDLGYVYCYNITGGGSTFVWSFTAGLNLVDYVSVAGGSVFAACWDGHLYCLNANTGAVNWTYPTQILVDTAPAISGGLVYFGTAANQLTCINATNANFKWNYNATYQITSASIFNNSVYIGADQNITCLVL